MPDDELETTTSTDERWKYTSTIASVLLVVSIPVLILGAALGFLSLNRIGQAWFMLYFVAGIAAVTYVFGEQTLDAVRKFRNG